MWKVDFMNKKYFCVLFLLLIILARILFSGQSVKVMRNMFFEKNSQEETERITVVLDAGHGGRDPGKVGVNNALEKEINLDITLKLANLLEQNDINVIMTRADDEGLYSESDSNKKRADLNKRIEIINSSHAIFAISIHQNSFSDGAVKGAQVFYYAQSEPGKDLAMVLQEQLKDTIKDGNHRQAKSNTNYYMLKHTTCPLVIVECGYLSNWTEAELLLDDDYQEKMAWAIHLGIMRFINKGINITN